MESLLKKTQVPYQCMSHLGSWEHWSPPKRHYCCAHYAARSSSLIPGSGGGWSVFFFLMCFLMFFGCLSHFFWMLFGCCFCLRVENRLFLLGASNLYVLVVGRLKKPFGPQTKECFDMLPWYFRGFQQSKRFYGFTLLLMCCRHISHGPPFDSMMTELCSMAFRKPSAQVHLIIWDRKACTQVAFS